MARDKKAAQKQKPAKAAAGAAADKAAAKKGKKAKQGSYDSLRDPLDRELALLGLRVKEITADGNCFFRALSDQLEGNEHQHSSLRAQVVGLMQAREDDFAPFVEDDQSFTAYTARMKKEGTWAGHMELQAASLLLQANIAVYQAGQPRWSITNFPPGSRLLHLSYHDGEHYNSVRRADDYSPGPPQPITDLVPVAHAGQLQSSWSADDEERVAAGTGCDNPALIQQQLAAAGGDVDAAIEAIIEILAAEEEPSSTAAAAEAAAATAAADAAGVECSIGAAAGDQQLQLSAAGETPTSAGQQAVSNSSDEAVVVEGTSTQLAVRQQSSDTEATAAAVVAPGCGSSSVAEQSADTAAAADAGTSSSPAAVHAAPQHNAAAAAAANGGHSKGVKLKGGSKLKHAKGAAAPGAAGDDKRPSRNKPCPCGSGRKHKNCCGLKGTGSGAPGGKQQEAVAGLPLQLATLHI